MTRPQKIVPCLWFDSNAEEAANFYTSLLPDSSIGRILRYGEAGQEITGKQPGSVLTVEFAMAGFHFVALNGGPQFTINPAISFFISCASETEAEALWAKLSAGGFALMPLDSYPWSKKYGWVQDRFGVSWQLMLGQIGDAGQKIVPCLMYVREQNGKAEEAIQRYTSVFDNAKVHGIDRYQAGEGNTEGAVKHAQFALNGESFVAMDGGVGHPFDFNEAVSLQIMCATQAEVDTYWEKLIANGGEAGPCGWLKDKFSVSWQVSPTVLGDMLHDPDYARSQRVTAAMFQMQKFDIDVLKRVYEGTTT
jgi:predicted 3-demethylubiquinone-9 3-methyltransferase (glyoxalase superfamily)